MLAKLSENFKNLQGYKFTEEFGIQKAIAYKQRHQLQEALNSCNGPGRRRKLNANALFLLYVKKMEGFSYKNIRQLFNLSKSRIKDNLEFIYDTLSKGAPECIIDGSKLIDKNNPILKVAIDSTDIPIKGCNANCGIFFSWKSNHDALKLLVVMNIASREILAIYFAPGSVHDKTMFEQSEFAFDECTIIYADKGFPGIDKQHKNVRIPRKRSKNRPLTKEDKIYNKNISSERIVVEHFFAWLKKFDIFKKTYLGSVETLRKIISILCATYNYMVVY